MYPDKHHLSCKEFRSLPQERKDQFDRLDEFVDFVVSHPDQVKGDLRYYITRVWFEDPLCQKLDLRLMDVMSKASFTLPSIRGCRSYLTKGNLLPIHKE